jgi:hypothetical protein
MLGRQLYCRPNKVRKEVRFLEIRPMGIRWQQGAVWNEA